MTHLSSSLPLTTPAITQTVARFRMLTTSQLRRLHYQGTERGQVVRSSRHLKRLAALGLLRRVWGVYGGQPEYVYMPPDSKARNADPHTLDVTELYVRLVNISDGIYEQNAEKLIFDPEPWCHVQVGHMVLKPDSYVDLGSMRYFIEVDRGTEFRSQLAQKMRRYLAAYERWDEPTFPLCIWVVHDQDRKRFMEGIIKSQAEPRLFACELFTTVVEKISRPNSRGEVGG